MPDHRRVDSLGRRAFLEQVGRGAAGAALLGVLGRGSAGAEDGERIKVAAVITEFTYRSHAHVIMENFLAPYLFNGEVVDPTREFEVVAMYLDQTPRRDMGRSVGKEYGIPIFPTIAEALTLGGKTLAADAVLAIGEHGHYPVNEKGQREYPRKRFFDEIAAVFKESGRVAPVFNDKHLSYRWDWAKEMYDTARSMGIPFMAGSSVPLAERRPPLEIPSGTAITEAVSIHGGPVEAYDFHGLEVLQAMVESRKGGANGIKSVQFLSGEALWKAAEQGAWSPSLADAALATELGPGKPTLRELLKQPPYNNHEPHGILLTYRDGLRGTVLRVGSDGTHWYFACKAKEKAEPLATSFYVGPWDNRNLFKALSHAIQWHFRHKRPPYPIERTLLTTGALAAAMDSRFEGGKLLETPQLAIAYEPVDYREFREMGASWKIVTEDTPQPRGIDPTGRNQLKR